MESQSYSIADLFVSLISRLRYGSSKVIDRLINVWLVIEGRKLKSRIS